MTQKSSKKVQKYENLGRDNDCVLDERVKSSKELPRLVVKSATSSIREVSRSSQNGVRIQDNLISGKAKSCHEQEQAEQTFPYHCVRVQQLCR